jgi:hypothetical protein
MYNFKSIHKLTQTLQIMYNSKSIQQTQALQSHVQFQINIQINTTNTNIPNPYTIAYQYT